MGFLGSLYSWMTGMAPLGELGIVAGAAFVWTLCLLGAVAVDGDDNPLAGITFLGALGGVIALIVGIDDGKWAHIVAGVMGLAVVPAIFGLVTGIRGGKGLMVRAWKAAKAWNDEQDRLETEARKRLTAEAQARAAAAERSPANVLKRCEAIVAAVRRAIPLTVNAPEQLAEAEAKLAALRELFALEARMQALTANLPTLDQRLAAADALYTDTSLEQQSPELLAKLREASATAQERQAAVHTATEELVAVIMTLPDRMQVQLTEDPPIEYQTAAADVADDLQVRLTQLSPPDPAVRPSRKAELA